MKHVFGRFEGLGQVLERRHDLLGGCGALSGSGLDCVRRIDPQHGVRMENTAHRVGLVIDGACSRRASAPSPRSPATSPTPTAPRLRGPPHESESRGCERSSPLEVKDFADFLTELDAGLPGGQVHVTEREDRLAEVAELLGPIGEAFPRLAAVLPPNLSRAVRTSVDGCLFPRGPARIAGCHSTSASSSAKKASRSSAFQASTARWTVSTFSCDIAYSDSPTASRASALVA